MSMKMTKTGTDSARMTFTYKSSGNTSRRQKMEMENHSRQFIDAILETTEHKLSKIVVNEDTIEVESVSKDLVVVQESMSPELQKMIAEMVSFHNQFIIQNCLVFRTKSWMLTPMSTRLHHNPEKSPSQLEDSPFANAPRAAPKSSPNLHIRS